jgi:hypothetical protein
LGINHGGVTSGTRQRLAVKGFASPAHYNSAIFNYLSDNKALHPPAYPVQALRYGENPRQSTTFYSYDPTAARSAATFCRAKNRPATTCSISMQRGKARSVLIDRRSSSSSIYHPAVSLQLIGWWIPSRPQKRDFPNAATDSKGRLLVGAAVGAGKDLEERVALQIKESEG